MAGVGTGIFVGFWGPNGEMQATARPAVGGDDATRLSAVWQDWLFGTAAATFTWQQSSSTDYQPRRAAALTTAVLASGCFFVGAPITTPAAPSFGWHRPLSEPTRPAPALARALQIATVLGRVPDAVAAAPSFDWHRPLNEPPRPAAAVLRAALGIGGAAIVIPPPPPSIGWNVALSEPTRRAPALGPHNQLATARGALAPLQTDIGLGMWFRPLAEPTRRAKALPTAAAPFWTGILQIIVPSETVTMDKWFRALALPVPDYPSRTRSYQYVATCVVPASTWVHSGGLSGSLNDVTLRGDSDAVAAMLRGSLNGVTLAGKRTN